MNISVCMAPAVWRQSPGVSPVPCANAYAAVLKKWRQQSKPLRPHLMQNSSPQRRAHQCLFSPKPIRSVSLIRALTMFRPHFIGSDSAGLTCTSVRLEFVGGEVFTASLLSLVFCKAMTAFKLERKHLSCLLTKLIESKRILHASEALA